MAGRKEAGRVDGWITTQALAAGARFSRPTATRANCLAAAAGKESDEFNWGPCARHKQTRPARAEYCSSPSTSYIHFFHFHFYFHFKFASIARLRQTIERANRERAVAEATIKLPLAALNCECARQHLKIDVNDVRYRRRRSRRHRLRLRASGWPPPPPNHVLRIRLEATATIRTIQTRRGALARFTVFFVCAHMIGAVRQLAVAQTKRCFSRATNAEESRRRKRAAASRLNNMAPHLSGRAAAKLLKQIVSLGRINKRTNMNSTTTATKLYYTTTTSSMLLFSIALIVLNNLLLVEQAHAELPADTQVNSSEQSTSGAPIYSATHLPSAIRDPLVWDAKSLYKREIADSKPIASGGERFKRSPLTSSADSKQQQQSVDACQSKLEVLNPYYATNSKGQLRTIVNSELIQQAVQVETCLR